MTPQEFNQIVGVDIDVFRAMSLKKRRELYSHIDPGDKQAVCDAIITREEWEKFSPGTLVHVFGYRGVPGIVIHSNGASRYMIFIHDVGIVRASRYDIKHV